MAGINDTVDPAEHNDDPFANADFNVPQEEVDEALRGIPKDGTNPTWDNAESQSNPPDNEEDNTGGDSPANNTNTDPTGSQSTPDNTGEEPSGQGDETNETSQASQETTENLDFSSISEEAGVEVSSREDMINLLRNGQQLQQRVARLENNRFDDLNPQIQAAIHYLSQDEKRTIADFAQVIGVDAESLDDKTAIRQKWMMDNKPMVQKNADFAQKAFERHFNSTYGGVKMPDFEDDDYETADEKRETWKKENQAEFDFASDKLKYDAQEARDFLGEQKDKALQVPEKDQQTNRSQELVNEYRQRATQELSNAPAKLKLSVDDNAAHDLEVDLSEVLEENKKLIVNDPKKAFAEMGLDLEADNIDSVKLNEILTRYKMWDKLPKLVFNHILSQKDLDTIERKIEHPQDTSTSARNPNDSISFGEKLAQAAEAEREAERRRMTG